MREIFDLNLHRLPQSGPKLEICSNRVIGRRWLYDAKTSTISRKGHCLATVLHKLEGFEADFP
eukprot:CAMPEP_0180505444 /NCGR_PEP_ID=MMETSP1036_2-20121128/47369_1 /TAXON_ID=632150 /ORGANISM="Azadinium spinosum, Strain 3D9" /LENGTH=62 /DNA_ID=CAMNT_0022515139 /DNA_START=327 /DNA_END=511 /DNA_ORIENTATION=+